MNAEAKPDKGILLRLNELVDYGFLDVTQGAASLLASNVPALVQIHKTQNDLLQRAFASFVFHSVYQAMVRRRAQGRITHAVIFDEAHRAAKLKLIPTMANEWTKYGLSLIVASQEVKHFDDSMFTAIASYLALRTSEPDARRMAKIFVPSDKLALLTDRIKQLEKYNGWFYSEGMRKPKLINSTVLITLTPEHVLSAAGTLWQAPGDEASETECYRRDRVGDVALHRCETRAG